MVLHYLAHAEERTATVSVNTFIHLFTILGKIPFDEIKESLLQQPSNSAWGLGVYLGGSRPRVPPPTNEQTVPVGQC
jgi:hypothetical protein